MLLDRRQLLMWAVSLAGGPLAPACHCGREASGGPVPVAGSRRGPPELHPEMDGMSVNELNKAIAKLVPLHKKLGAPLPGDWLAEHEEPGQTFAEYRASKPITPDVDGSGKRRLLYIQPLGPLTKTQRSIVELTGDYMRRFFGLEVRFRPELPLSLLPGSARRVHPSWGVPQILTSYVLEKVLEPRLPDDAAAYISFTASDLWPGEGWNFVFGQASLRDRVGVWSIYRYGDPDASASALKLALRRALKVAVHETGHMFSLRHCTAYECVMGGSNNLAESDRRPLALCPECTAKICWATKRDPVSRCRELQAFAEQHGFAEDAAFFRRAVEALEEP
jgi:archaemetzincin